LKIGGHSSEIMLQEVQSSYDLHIYKRYECVPRILPSREVIAADDAYYR